GQRRGVRRPTDGGRPALVAERASGRGEGRDYVPLGTLLPNSRVTGTASDTRNTISAITTIEGPDAVSQVREPNSPPTTAMVPRIAATTAIISGVALSRRAVAAGMISSEVISNTPTSFMAMAITDAIRIISTNRLASGRNPSASASSGLTVEA